MPDAITIRPLRSADIAPAAALLRRLAVEFILHDCPPEQASTFLRENDADGIARYLAQGFVYHVAEIDGQLAGFIGMRERHHLFHLFVGVPWQGRGLARRLWDQARAQALADGAAATFTVNASNYALDAYRKLGFERSAPMVEKNGIRFNPMQWLPPAA